MSVTDLAREAAERYLAMVSLRQMITEELAAAVAKSTIPEQHAAVVQRFTDCLLPIVVRIFVDQAVNHFAVAELHALVRFYGSAGWWCINATA